MIVQLSSDVNALVPSSKSSGSRRPRVLVAEDNDDVLAALGMLLKSNGYDAELVQTPADALKALDGEIFDALLLDLNYSRDTTSGADGLELLSKVQAIDSTLAVVAMTAWGTVELVVDAMHRGACEFVQKPWDNEHLLQVLQKQMHRSRALREKSFREKFEAQDAAQIQRALLPARIAAPEGVTVVASTQSARTVGGDYYDVIPIDEQRFAICIADAMGKGLGAALLMSNLQAIVRMLAPEVASPRELCNRVNRAVHVPGKFITFFFCVLDVSQKKITYTNAGHNWPILARRDGRCERLSTDDAVLGTLAYWDYHQQEKELRSGDRLVLFTDGITEGGNNGSDDFGEENLLEFVSLNVARPVDELKDLILKSANASNDGSLVDDATLIVAAIS
ncbi:MAG TPA: SpoIIE family protein phosphatase [Candidatus Sulfotelmatobacter sp.]|nr:SpoIIE family protein phosphatase [Candidatus Sulfotelmatobacter sp.]